MALSKRWLATLMSVAAVATLAAGLALGHVAVGVPQAQASASDFNEAGNLLITDQFNNRAIEINPVTKRIVWSFGTGNPKRCKPGPGEIIGLNDAERLSGGLTLLAGTGIPAGASPSLPNGCVDNRVIVVDRLGTIVWQYGQAGQTGDGPNLLNVPVFAIQLPNHNILIVDQSNERVIEVDRDNKAIVWSYGCLTCNLLNNPNSAELLPNGHILIADENNNRVIEVNPTTNQIVWQYSQGLNFAAFASRLPNGDTLITDSGNSRILEVDASGGFVSQYFTNTAPDSNSSPLPTNAVRLANGETSIADQFNDRALIIDASQHIVFQYGMTNVVGVGPNQLNGPYTAFVIGDYTGQTVPPAQF